MFLLIYNLISRNISLFLFSTLNCFVHSVKHFEQIFGMFLFFVFNQFFVNNNNHNNNNNDINNKSDNNDNNFILLILLCYY